MVGSRDLFIQSETKPVHCGIHSVIEYLWLNPTGSETNALAADNCLFGSSGISNHGIKYVVEQLGPLLSWWRIYYKSMG